MGAPMSNVDPFGGQLSLEEFQLRAEMKRQEDFERRIIEKLFKYYNAGLWYGITRKKLNSGSQDNQFTFAWFNQHGNYPVKLRTEKYNKRHTLEYILKSPYYKGQLQSLEIWASIRDLHDSYGEDCKAAVITRFPDTGKDVVISNVLYMSITQGVVHSTPKNILVCEDTEPLVVELLEHFLARCRDVFEWDPAEVME